MTTSALVPYVVMCRGKANFVATGGNEAKARVAREQKSLRADILACVIFSKRGVKIVHVVSRRAILEQLFLRRASRRIE